MRRLAIAITVSIAAVSITAHAGYRDLKKDLDGYRPPSHYQGRFVPGPEKTDNASAEDFSEAKRRIAEMKSRWEKSLTTETEAAAFIRYTPEDLKMIQGAAVDKDIALKFLAGTYSLKTLELLTLFRNHDIRAAEDRFRAAVERFSQVAALDEILRRYSAFTEGLMTGVGPMRGKDPVSMKFPFPGVLSLKGEIVQKEVASEREKVEISRRDAVTRIRKTYWNLIYIIKSQKITTGMVDLLRYLETVANSRYEAGKTSYQDVIKVRINRETMEEDLVTLGERRRNRESVIREILNLSPQDSLGLPKLERLTGKTPSLDKLYPVAKKQRQELRRLRFGIQKKALLIEMAETMILPPYTLNLSLYEDEAVRRVGSSAGKAPFPVSTESSRGAGLPQRPWYGAQDAYLREMRQKLSASKNDLIESEAATNTMVRNAWFKLDRAQRENTLYRESVVKLSKSALDVSTRGYESGKVSFADVIDSYTIWLKANLTHERNRSDVGIAWADLERTTGTLLN
jgi:outer membrane protein, heavy metal efflux system